MKQRLKHNNRQGFQHLVTKILTVIDLFMVMKLCLIQAMPYSFALVQKRNEHTC